jgi:hypothetical protein
MFPAQQWLAVASPDLGCEMSIDGCSPDADATVGEKSKAFPVRRA